MPRRVEPQPPPGPRFPVTFDSGVASLVIHGPGIEKPLTCKGTCTFPLWEGTYWLDIHASGRVWTTPVQVREAERVLIDAPNESARGIGFAAIVVGSSIFAFAGFVTWVIGETCAEGAYHGSAECESREAALPYWLTATGVGAVATAVGIGLYLGNNSASAEVLPAPGSRARRGPGTFVGLGPVEGSTLPGLSLQVSF